MTRMIGGVFGVAALTAMFDHLSASRAAAGFDGHDVFIYALSHSLRYSAAFALTGAFVAWFFIRSHHAEPEQDAVPAAAFESVALESGD
jgi:hypothetical protein